MYLYRLLLAIFVLGLLGVLGELLLLGHFEDWQQFIPLAMITLGVGVALVWAWRPSTGSLRFFQATLLLFAVSGVAGFYLHYQGNVEFEIEMDPSVGGLALFREAMTGATPALAPGTMLLFAAVGYALMASRRGLPGPTGRG
jgi:hypothetical protein